MRINGNFPSQVVLVLVAAVILLAYPLSVYGSSEVLAAVAAGAVLGTVNVLLGYFAIMYSFDKSYTTFLKAVIGGMGARMLLLLGALTALIMVAHMHAVALTVSLLGFYMIYLILEILFIQRRVSEKKS